MKNLSGGFSNGMPAPFCIFPALLSQKLGAKTHRTTPPGPIGYAAQIMRMVL